jgi:hypothetical protein
LNRAILVNFFLRNYLVIEPPRGRPFGGGGGIAIFFEKVFAFEN